MPWIKFRNRRYYVRRSRREGRRHSQYIGVGPKAEQAAAEDAQRRAEQLTLNQRRKDDQAAWQRSVRPLDQLAAVACALMKGVLVAAGYHQHDRGEWRRKREQEA